jgi:hypothetical protein
MSEQTPLALARPRSERTDLYVEITDKIIAEPESGPGTLGAALGDRSSKGTASAYRRTPRLAASTNEPIQLGVVMANGHLGQCTHCVSKDEP